MVTVWNAYNERLEGSTERLKWKKFIFQVVFQKIQVLCKALESSDVSFVHHNSKVRLLHIFSTHLTLFFYIRYYNEHNVYHAT